MPGSPAVLQVVILRDGLLVGTEVFVAGAYTIGSSEEADLRLDGDGVDSLHAVFYFQNGKVAVQDSGSRGGLYVNGHKVATCEVRSVDEVSCGPFVLKARVLSQKGTQAKPEPSPEVSALLSGGAATTDLPPRRGAVATPIVRAPDKAKPKAPVSQNPTVAAPPKGKVDPFAQTTPKAGPGKVAPTAGTVVSQRRASQAAPVPPPPPPDDFGSDQPTEFMAKSEFGGRTEPTDVLAAPRTRAERPSLAVARARAKLAPPARSVFSEGGKGAARLYFELFWGTVRHEARSFGPKAKAPLLARADTQAALPLWGFTLPDEGMVIAEPRSSAYRVYAPPKASVEKLKGSSFEPLGSGELEKSGGKPFVTLSLGMAARFSEGDLCLVAYVAPPPAKVFVNPLKSLPKLALFNFLVLFGAFLYFVVFGPKPSETADFNVKNLPQVAVRLIAPEPKKKEAAQKKLEELKEQAKKAEKKKEEPKPEKVVAKAPLPTQKVFKALAKFSAAGPPMGDVLAAIDKMGSGPGSKNVKSNFKLAEMIGKGPINNAGLGTFGLGGGGKGGGATLGAELLRGRGGGGIGAMGAGSFGRGNVSGTVTRASARSVSVQGSIDREAVAKVVNSHLQEVRACYERALLKDPGLAGKIVLEWTISTAGKVVTAKTKTSTLQNVSVEACILQGLKGWVFPPAKGGQVIVSYPFLFNSVGY